jgi:glycerophosphoryl diester phosphodiesterase
VDSSTISTVTPTVVAHRGASAHRAEHTLAAYALALAQGSGGVECDVRLTRDGHLVCVHDRTVNRTSTGRGVVSELTLDHMSTLDYGHWHDEFPESADELILRRKAVPSADPEGRGLLTLDALLDLVTDTAPDTKLFIETKHPVRYGALVEAKLIALLARHGLAKPAHPDDSQVVVMSFSARAVHRIRLHAPTLPTVLLLDRIIGRRDGSLPPGVTMTGPGIHLLRADPDYVRRARLRGHDTYCWTVDDPADVELCRSLGVRYLATNSPVSTLVTLGD